MSATGLFSVAGKIALVTGGGRGIGAAVAKGLCEAGAKVGVFDRELSEALPKDARFFECDLGNRNHLRETFTKFVKDLGGIDILVNSAGVTRGAPAETYPEQDWDLTLSINLSAAFLLCQLAGQQMIAQKRGGSIINLTSIGGHQGFPGNPAYCASKGGMRQMTKALAFDWGRHGIRVNNLAPGYTHTPMNIKSWETPELKQQRADHTMLGRWGEPNEMVGPVIFLSSEASRYMTGQDLLVDGGWTSKGM